MNDKKVVKYGSFIILDEGATCGRKWFDDFRNVIIFLKMQTLKKITDKVLLRW